MDWNGAEWKIEPSATITQAIAIGVSMLSANDVWEVGYHWRDGPESTFIMHWDGVQWSQVPSPNPCYSNVLRRVSGVSKDDVWAIGYSTSCSMYPVETLILHWDGVQWSQVPSPNPNPQDNRLRDVEVVSKNDVWAVGYQGSNPDSHTLTLHWDGVEWGVVDSPNVSSNQHLLGVGASSANDVWAVGDFTNAGLLILHWNGFAWSVIPGPTWLPGNSDHSLYDVESTSNQDAWIVGYYLNEGPNPDPGQPLTLHWDGEVWTSIPSHGPGLNVNILESVAATSESDVWGAGSYWDGFGYPFRTLIEHYSPGPGCTPEPTVTGTPPTRTPTVTRTPTITNTPMLTPEACGSNSNFAVSATTGGSFIQGTTDIGNHCSNCYTSISLPFAVSLYDRTFTTANVSANGLVQFGSSLLVQDSCLPNPDLDYAVLPYWGPFQTDQGGGIYTRIEGQAPDRVFIIEWRVCRTTGPNTCSGYSNFEVKFHENSPTQQFEFVYSEMESGGLYGSVGVQKGHGSYITQYSCHTSAFSRGSQLTFTLQPCPTTATPTATATITVTSTSTGCAITFSDVPQDSLFYPYIRCMSCRGIISGYPDGTFRPNNDVTRGQLAKIVSKSVGFNDDPGPQLFEDVPVGSTFYSWVNRLAIRGYISGYPCGGVGERCGSGNLPYFRPNANASRGQISKVVSNAAGLAGDPIGQTFEDVPPANPFYLWIERLASRGIMGGYPCGGEGEPCGADNEPYFRPGNNATRGQTSKIVANTFFPDCQVGVR